MFSRQNITKNQITDSHTSECAPADGNISVNDVHSSESALAFGDVILSFQNLQTGLHLWKEFLVDTKLEALQRNATFRKCPTVTNSKLKD